MKNLLINADFTENEKEGVIIMTKYVEKMKCFDSIEIPKDKYSPYDAIITDTKGNKFLAEHKIRNVVYNDFMFEDKKYKSLLKAKEELGAKGILYINTIVYDNYYRVLVYNITDKYMDKQEERGIYCRNTTAGYAIQVYKKVYFLDTIDAKKYKIDKEPVYTKEQEDWMYWEDYKNNK